MGFSLLQSGDPQAAAATGSLLEIHILGPPGPEESVTVLEPGTLSSARSFHPLGSGGMLKFESHRVPLQVTSKNDL